MNEAGLYSRLQNLKISGMRALHNESLNTRVGELAESLVTSDFSSADILADHRLSVEGNKITLVLIRFSILLLGTGSQLGGQNSGFW